MNAIEREQSRAERVEISRVLGDYYRDISLNYSQYELSTLWPMPPKGHKPYSIEQLNMYNGVHIHSQFEPNLPSGSGRRVIDTDEPITVEYSPDDIIQTILAEEFYNELVPDHFEQIGI